MIDVLLSEPVGKQPVRAEHGLSEPEYRLYDSIPANVDYVYHPSFSLPQAERRLFGADAPEIDVPQYSLAPVLEESCRSQGRDRGALTADEEKTLFLRYNYARYRLAGLQARQQRRFSAARAKAMAGWQERVLRLRAALARANLPLVHAMAKRAKIGSVEFNELISEGNLAVLRCLEKFNVARGFKFSTYACRAILKSFQRFAARAGRHQKVFAVEFDPQLERSDYAQRRHEQQRTDSIETVREVLRQNRARLSETERTVILQRFPIFSGEAPRTLAQVGRTIRMTNEGVRQIQKRALSKLQAVIEEQSAA
jgi:RNA polymerase primary sigma factor